MQSCLVSKYYTDSMWVAHSQLYSKFETDPNHPFLLKANQINRKGFDTSKKKKNQSDWYIGGGIFL